MANQFEDALFKDIFTKNKSKTGNLLKAEDIEVTGKAKISCEDDLDGVRILLKKDANDNLKEIKFVCSCGQTKSIILDYSE
ncbi:hypothetical protein [Stygiobacter electus]|uniref:Uncharacterized protein n=1 Tax=Stygiobacter electus TaxID=3032292 RepID=A0AAE3NZ44_9BACT|nr:hypothetical protein [Stygiobacter electus]MDF1611270.1 hypothetical protein [Stygiobacter electus]